MHCPHFLVNPVNAARCRNSKTNLVSSYDHPISSPSLVMIGWRTPESNPEKVRQKCAKSSITLPRIVRFRWNFILCLNTWRQKLHRNSSSRGQSSRSQRYVTRKIFYQIMNNSGLFDFDKIYYRLWPYDTRSTTNFQGQRVTTQGHSVSWRISIKNRYISWTDSLTEFKVCADYVRA